MGPQGSLYMYQSRGFQILPMMRLIFVIFFPQIKALFVLDYDMSFVVVFVLRNVPDPPTPLPFINKSLNDRVWVCSYPIIKLEKWSPNIPLVCVLFVSFISKNIKYQNQFALFFVGGGILFDCLSFLSLTQFQKKEAFLTQSCYGNMFITHFLYKPPHFLIMLVEICPYLLRKIFKSQSYSWM